MQMLLVSGRDNASKALAQQMSSGLGLGCKVVAFEDEDGMVRMVKEHGWKRVAYLAPWGCTGDNSPDRSLTEGLVSLIRVVGRECPESTLMVVTSGLVSTSSVSGQTNVWSKIVDAGRLEYPRLCISSIDLPVF